MPRQTFTWFPDQNSQQECTPLVTTTKFGDGYELRTLNGINTSPMKWSVSFERTRVEALAILEFLRARKGYESFIWKNPLEEEGVYVCKSWSTTSQQGYMTVRCSFEQVFEPAA